MKLEIDKNPFQKNHLSNNLSHLSDNSIKLLRTTPIFYFFFPSLKEPTMVSNFEGKKKKNPILKKKEKLYRVDQPTGNGFFCFSKKHPLCTGTYPR
jgi:hypothetical protein